MNIGDRIRIIGVPENLKEIAGDDAGDGLVVKSVFERCLGLTFPIIDITNGLIELEVGEVFGEAAYMRSIWIEPDSVALLENSNESTTDE